MHEPVPFIMPLEPATNEPGVEFIFGCVEGLPAARAKRLILQARQIGIIDDEQTQRIIDALGLGGA